MNSAWRSVTLLVLLAAMACTPRASDSRLRVPGIDALTDNGMFDPAFQRAPDGRLWMSFSAVRADSRYGRAFNAIATRLAVSDDDGRHWQDRGEVNAVEDLTVSAATQAPFARWEQEVARLLYDPYAPPATRWKLVWHRYLREYDGHAVESVPRFEHGWVGLREAASPEGPWSAERKLFAGALYDARDDRVLGPPEMRLDHLAQLSHCQAFTEPGMLAEPSGIEIVMRCANGPDHGGIVLLRCDHELRGCTYRATLLADGDAAQFGAAYTGFSGADLALGAAHAWLIVTPTSPPAESYRGCLAFRFASLSEARLETTPAFELRGDAGSFNGACAYADDRVAGGIHLSQYRPLESQRFQIHATGRHLP